MSSQKMYENEKNWITFSFVLLCSGLTATQASKFPTTRFAFQSIHFILRYIIDSFVDCSMAQSKACLHRVAQCHTLVRTHIDGVERQFNEYDAIAQNAIAYHVWAPNEFIERINKHAKPIVALMNEIDSLRKMMIRIIQVQREQINKYWKSIRDGRKTVKRGAPASLESVTMETMIQMSLRVIQDMKDAIPSLIQPLASRIHRKLCTLQQRMLLFKQFTESDSCNFGPDDCRCDCPPCRHGQCYECHEGNCCRPCQCNRVGFGISCHACHQGAHEQCKCNCSLRQMIKSKW